MIHSGRHRYKTHAGIPHSSSNALSTKLSFYYQCNSGITLSSWADQSANNNDLLQDIEDDQAELYLGGYHFEADDNNFYDLQGGQITISSEEGFVIFLVCEVETTSSNMCILGLDNTHHFVELMAGGDSFRLRLSSTNSTVTPTTSNLFVNASGRFLVTIERQSGGTGNINLYKNGILLDQDPQVSNTGDGEFITLGARLDNPSSGRFFDGTMFDIAMIEASAATRDHVNRIHAYLTSKHGLHGV